MVRTLARPRFLARRPLSALLRQWPLGLADEVEGIHQTRVASRRLRELVPILAVTPDDPGAIALRRGLRDITRLFGPSRELDVSGLTLAAIEQRLPSHAPAIAVVRAHVDRERAKAGRARRHASRAAGIDGLAEGMRDLALQADSRAAIRGCAARAAARLDRRARQLQTAVLGAGFVFAAGPLHRVRVALKKFRYALEAAGRLGRFRLTGTMLPLKVMQDLLGDLHDLQVLAGHARDAAALAPPSRRPPVAALVDDIDDTIRGLHGRFVIERGSLIAVLGRSTRVRDALIALPPPDPGPARASRRSHRRRLRED